MTDGVDQLGHDLLGLPVRQAEEDDVEAGEVGRVERREHQVGVRGQPATGRGPSRGAPAFESAVTCDHLDLGMPREQAQQLGPGVPRGPDDPDATTHDRHRIRGCHATWCIAYIALHHTPVNCSSRVWAPSLGAWGRSRQRAAARRQRKSGRGRVVLLAGVCVALAVVIALALGRSDRTRTVDSSLAHGDRNPLASIDSGPARTAPPATTLVTTPPTTLPRPVPMVLPAGPAPAIARITTTDPVIFLGIDDGLVRDPAALDFLETHRWPFTAFLVNGALQADPAFWARARAIGGTVEAHTVTHPNLTKVSAERSGTRPSCTACGTSCCAGRSTSG